MRRAGYCAAVGVVLVALAATGCAGRREPERTPVSFWTSRTPASLASALRAFEDANPTLRVDLRSLSESELADSIESALEAGHAPDLVDIGAGELGPWLRRGAMTDWSAGVADLRPLLRGWEPCMVGDAIYALPWTLRAPLLLYDRALLARVHADTSDAPATWDQFRSTVARVSRLPDGTRGFGIASGSPVEYAGAWLAWAPGADEAGLPDPPGSGRFSSVANRDALAFLQSLVPFSLMAPQDSLEREFVRGKLALVVADPSVAAEARAAGRSVGLAPLPRRPGTAEEIGSYATVEVLASFTTSRHKEDALRLARSLVDPASLAMIAATEPGLLPARAGADTLPGFRDRAEAVDALRLLATSRHQPHVRGWDLLEFHIGEAVADVLAGRVSPEAALAAADTFAVRQRASR